MSGEGLLHNLRKLLSLVKNKTFSSFCLLLMFSRVGFIFFFRIQGLVLIDKGFDKDILSNFILITIVVEVVFNIIVKKPNQGFLQYGMTYYRFYLISQAFTLFYLYFYDSYKTHQTLTIIILIIINIYSNWTKSHFTLGFNSFYAKISDRELGGTYLTALYSINNLSMNLPGLLIYPAIDKIGYLFVGVVSLLYSIGFILLFSDKVVSYDEIDIVKWKAKVDVKDDKKVNPIE